MRLCKPFGFGASSFTLALLERISISAGRVDLLQTPRSARILTIASLCTLTSFPSTYSIQLNNQKGPLNSCNSQNPVLGCKNQKFNTGYGIRDYSTQQNSDCRNNEMASNDLVRLDFEVYGRVQGVFFRKYTQQQGKDLGLRGFCRNTSAGTVTGSLEGPRAQIDQMKTWLKTTGSPQSRIDKVDFKNEKNIDGYTYKGQFGIERTI